MEVQPELLVAEPVPPRADSPHELNSTGGDFTPLFHESSTPEQAAGAEPPVSDPARLVDNYSYLTSQGLMNGSPETGAAERQPPSQPAGQPSPSKKAEAPSAAAQATSAQEASNNGPV
ncbi:uncharacterized protein LOC119107845 [Pollicipes pollicipes]|uniref:uncharacterized protein LOC119107845 n=1 Tax=Pollicipes pollicipes TaxID=41117 RepID=UPI0018849276|nr:uncharacterized protein LOC119107845 [Pollicipes pollicipes]